MRLAWLVPLVAGEVYLRESFDDERWDKRWIVPRNFPPKDEAVRGARARLSRGRTFKRRSPRARAAQGEWAWSAGAWHGDPADRGIQTVGDLKKFMISAPFTKPVKRDGKDLVIQYTVKHEQKIDCGGAYIKLLGKFSQVAPRCSRALFALSL